MDRAGGRLSAGTSCERVDMMRLGSVRFLLNKRFFDDILILAGRAGDVADTISIGGYEHGYEYWTEIVLHDRYGWVVEPGRFEC